jgi:hypothetical protein
MTVRRRGEHPPALLHHVANKNPSMLFTLLIFRLSRDVEGLAFNKIQVSV